MRIRDGSASYSSEIWAASTEHEASTVSEQRMMVASASAR